MKPDLILNRINYTEWGCQGILSIPILGGDPYRGAANGFCLTLEPDWAWNKPFVSCIPKGYYIIKLYSSPKFGSTYIITDVKNRNLILFHSGNTIEDTEGCIVLGESFSNKKQLGIGETNQLVLSRSREAHKEFMSVLDNKKEASILIIGNSLVETDLIIKGLDIKRKGDIESGKLVLDELSWASKLTDKTTQALISINEGISQFKREKEMTAPPKWKKVLNFISSIIQFGLSIWVKSKGVVLFK